MIAATHDGIFHADDVVAGAILRMVYPEIVFIRTRDEAKLASADVVFDVGSVFNPVARKFDHHQRGRAKKRPNGVEYSSAGLIWEAYGRMLVTSNEVFVEVDRAFMAPVDAVDNGQQIIEGGRSAFEGVSHLGLSGVLSSLNPNWQDGGDFDAAYEEAVNIAAIFVARAIRTAEGKITAAALARDAISRSDGGAIIEMSKFFPWLESAIMHAPKALYGVYPSETGTWMVQAIPPKLGSFAQRKPLPANWAGLRDADLAALTDVSDAVFCHPGRFICGAKTREGALRLARLAVEHEEKGR